MLCWFSSSLVSKCSDCVAASSRQLSKPKHHCEAQSTKILKLILWLAFFFNYYSTPLFLTRILDLKKKQSNSDIHYLTSIIFYQHAIVPWQSNLSVISPSSKGSLLPVLLLLIEFSYNGKKSADESVAGVVLVSLGSQKIASPLRISQFLLQLHILLAEKHQVLFQLGHLLCRGTQRYSRLKHCTSSFGISV